MGSTWSLHSKEGLGVGPFSERIQNRYGVETFSQFTGAQMMADKYGFSREDLDAFALESHKRAAAATANGSFEREILPLEIVDADGHPALHVRDEGIRADATIESLGAVRLLQENGKISAANASQICDGASGVLVVSERALADTASRRSREFTTSPSRAATRSSCSRSRSRRRDARSNAAA